MFAKNNQISGRQVMRLLTFDLLGYSALMIPQELARVSGRDGIFGILIGVGAGLLYLWILQALLRKMKGSYMSCLEDSFGQVGGKLVKFCYGIYFVVLGGRIAFIFARLVVSELLEKEFHLILVLILLLVYYGGTGGIEGRARIYEILFWILLIPLFIMMAFSLPTVDMDYWTPVLMEPVVDILQGAYQVFVTLSILFLVPFLTEFVGDKKRLYACGKTALLLVGGILGVLYLILLGMFGSNALAAIDYPVVTMMSRIQITGGFLKRIDAIMFGIWFFTLFALISSLVFFGAHIWSDFVKGHKKCSLFVEVVLVFLVAEGCYLMEGFEQLCEKAVGYIGTPFVILIPVLLCMVQKEKGDAA